MQAKYDALKARARSPTGRFRRVDHQHRNGQENILHQIDRLIRISRRYRRRRTSGTTTRRLSRS
ncbi:MAG: hypothetical protein ACLR5G_01335 [Eubacteriales bacterium]